jgi:hypothetical protein
VPPTVTAAEPVTSAAPGALPGETDYHALNAMLNLYDADGFHVVRCAHQFEAVQVWNATLAGHHIARVGELGTEVVVARADHAADQRSVVFVVQEGDDLFGDIPTVVDIRRGMPTAVGGQHQHVRLVDLDASVQRDPGCGHSQLLDEAVGVLRHAGEVDKIAHRRLLPALQIPLMSMLSPQPRPPTP